MADQKGTADPKGQGEGSGAAAAGADAGAAPKDDKGGAGAGSGDGEGDGGNGDEHLDPTKHNIPGRKSAGFFVGLRKGQKAAKAAEAGADGEGKPKPDNGDGGGSGDADEDNDEELTPAGRKAIQEEIAPLADSLRQQADDKDVADYIGANPDHKKYEPLVRKYMAHESYRGVAVEFIFSALAGKDAMTELAKLKGGDAAARETRANNVGGGRTARRGEGGEMDYGKLSAEQMEAEIEKAKGM